MNHLLNGILIWVNKTKIMEIGNRVELLTNTITKDISLKVHNMTRGKLIDEKLWLYLCAKITRHTWRISVIGRNVRI